MSDTTKPAMELPAPLAALVNLTCNVVCRLCGWTSVYPMSAYDTAGKEAGNHLASRHPAEAVALFDALKETEEAP